MTALALLPSREVRRIGAIDVGTNSIRLIVAEAAADGSYRILDDEKETTRLGCGLETTGKMTADAMEKSALAIDRMKRIAEGYGVEVLRAVGTCAIREAANRDDFLGLVRARADLAIEPIDAETEARLAHLSVAHAFDLRGLATAVVDIGGGSTEVVLSSGGLVEEVYSLPLGAVRLTEQFGGAEACAGEYYAEMRRAVRRVLERGIRKLPFIPQLIIGTGGTFMSLANMALHRDQPPGLVSLSRSTVRGHELKRSQVRHLIDWLRKLPLRDWARVPGLSPDRADIIVAGATIVERAMKHLAVNRLQVHDGGIRDGLLRTMVRALFPHDSAATPEVYDRLRSVRQFAAACTYEEHHCNHVTQLAGQLFDQLAEAFPAAGGGWSEPGNRLILEAAALLHDVGYLINYAKHHQHSYHLSAHSDLAGFTPREIELVAQVARYHSGARPQASHPEFARLSKPDRRLVRRLAAILRIADGLDRNRLQSVRGVRLRVADGTACFLLDADRDPAVDVWAAVRQSRLFRRVFGVKPRFAWTAAPNGMPAAGTNGTADAGSAGLERN